VAQADAAPGGRGPDATARGGSADIGSNRSGSTNHATDWQNYLPTLAGCYPTMPIHAERRSQVPRPSSTCERRSEIRNRAKIDSLLRDQEAVCLQLVAKTDVLKATRRQIFSGSTFFCRHRAWPMTASRFP
jgi:hypothetical protein